MATGEVNMYRRFAVPTVWVWSEPSMARWGAHGPVRIRRLWLCPHSEANAYAINTFGTHESGYGSAGILDCRGEEL